MRSKLLTTQQVTYVKYVECLPAFLAHCKMMISLPLLVVDNRVAENAEMHCIEGLERHMTDVLAHLQTVRFFGRN